LINYTSHYSLFPHPGTHEKLTDQVLRALRILLVLGQIVKEQLDIRAEVCVRAVRRGSQETVHLHGAVVTKVQVEFEACDGDGCDGRAGLGDGPDTAIAAEPGVMLA
jgi:hypothetical protein